MSSQRRELKKFCELRSWKKIEKYEDTQSGAKWTREGLDELMKEVRKGRVDVVVTYKLDRLGRSLPQLAMLIEELTRHRVAVICTSQGIDTTDQNPAGKLQLAVLMAVAEFERDIIKERTVAGLEAARARGKRLGRPPTLQKRAAEVKDLLGKGRGLREISRLLEMPYSSVKLVRDKASKQPL